MEMFLTGSQIVFGSGVEPFPEGISPAEGQECEAVAGGLGTAPPALRKEPGEGACVMGTGLGHGSLQAVNPQLRKAGRSDTLRTWPLSSEPASITSGCVTQFLHFIKWGYNCLTSQTCCEDRMAHVQGRGTQQASWGRSLTPSSLASRDLVPGPRTPANAPSRLRLRE